MLGSLENLSRGLSKIASSLEIATRWSQNPSSENIGNNKPLLKPFYREKLIALTLHTFQEGSHKYGVQKLCLLIRPLLKDMKCNITFKIPWSDARITPQSKILHIRTKK